MRPIDADELSAWLNKRLRCCNKGSIVEACLWTVLDMVDSAPAISLPLNDPLTLEQLREMDGEPVWVERLGYGKHWALVQVWAKSTNVIYLICNNGMVLHPQPELENGAKIYRRKPEEEEKNGKNQK